MEPRDACAKLFRQYLGEDADDILGDRVFCGVTEFIDELEYCHWRRLEIYQELLVREEETKILSEDQYNNIIFLLRGLPE